MEELVLEEYRIEKELGSGAFGKVVSATSTITNERVAVKLEKKVKGRPQFLAAESQVLAAIQGAEGVPKIYGSGAFGHMTCMVMELLGPNLDSLFKQLEKHFELRTIIQIAIQGVERVQHVHSCYYMHRDIKPQNFMFGVADKQTTLYIADFGLAKKYQNGPQGMHVPYREEKPFVGTACYASLNTHLGVQQSRRDDLESLMYVICYLLQSHLPWQCKHRTREEKHNATRLLKMLTSPEELFKERHHGFTIAFAYVKSIGYDDMPDYAHLKRTFRSIAAESQVTLDLAFEWLPGQKRRPKHLKTQGKQSSFVLSDTGRKRSLSPSSATQLRVTLSALPVMPTLDSSENTSYEGWQEEEEEGDDTVKETKGPTIDRRLLPVRSL
jgi:serine/threonine protein kinase